MSDEPLPLCPQLLLFEDVENQRREAEEWLARMAKLKPGDPETLKVGRNRVREAQ